MYRQLVPLDIEPTTKKHYNTVTVRLKGDSPWEPNNAIDVFAQRNKG